MRSQWLRNVSLVLSLVQVILSYRFSRLPRWARVLRLLFVQLPAFVAGAVRASRPTSLRSEWWYVGGQMLSITLAILWHRYPSRRPLLRPIAFLAFLAGIFAGIVVGQRRRFMRPLATH
jgi:hypothetical protein